MTRFTQIAGSTAMILAMASVGHAQTAATPDPATTVEVETTEAPAADAVATTTVETAATEGAVAMGDVLMANALIGANLHAVTVDDATWGTDYYVDPYPAAGEAPAAAPAAGDAVVAAETDNVGSVTDVALSTDGRLLGVVADVGGFLGMGTHQVMLGMDDIRIYRQDGWGNDYQVVSRLTREQLEALPEFDY